MVEEKHDLYQFDDQFRDTLSTVDTEGKRVWMFPKKPAGRWHNARTWFSVFLYTLFFGTPFIQWNGHPFMLFNFIERRFIIFGNVFWPQDFFLLAITLVTFFVFITLFTVAFGRLWCGWACPQTLFLEMGFRKLEYWIEGDAPAQRRLNSLPWNTEKVRKKITKHAIFILISIFVAHIIMAYIIGMGEVKKIITESPSEHLPGFIGLFIFTALFYGNFAWFREQACIAVCPYGRLQGVLLVKDSLTVIYDWVRGEPRGKLTKGHDAEKKGDCIDCKLCVHVCPTGIDIRNGIQMECVNCTACIDACNDVMEKVNRPKGLIRFSSQHGIEKGIQKIITPRVIAYSAVLLGLMGLLSFLIVTRSNIEMTILKKPGTLYMKMENNLIANMFEVELVNKTFDNMDVDIKVLSPASATLQKLGNPGTHINKEDISKEVYLVKIPRTELTGVKTTFVLGVYRNGELLTKGKATFVGPL